MIRYVGRKLTDEEVRLLIQVSVAILFNLGDDGYTIEFPSQDEIEEKANDFAEIVSQGTGQSGWPAVTLKAEFLKAARTLQQGLAVVEMIREGCEELLGEGD